MMKTNPETVSTTQQGLEYLVYLSNYWLSEELWLNQSQYAHIQAAQILNIPIHQLASTTNHLEAFNGVLKNKYL